MEGGGCIYSGEFSGAVAQLGERRASSAEVRGSIPFGSTLRSGLPIGAGQCGVTRFGPNFVELRMGEVRRKERS
jgi:hypothetical protein